MKIMGGFFMRNGRRTISVLLVAAMTAGLAACGTTEAAENVTESETPENTDYNFTVSYDGIQTGDVSSGVAVHDPSIYEEDGTYYIFGSHMSAAKVMICCTGSPLRTDTTRRIRSTVRSMVWQTRRLPTLAARTA